MQTPTIPSSLIAGSRTLKRHSTIPGIVVDEVGEPVFSAPWQAQVFAMAVALNEGDVFTWSEWAKILGREIAGGTHGEGDDGYYQAWLAALETIVKSKGVANQYELEKRYAAWNAAALKTPHGMPIELK